MLATVGVPAEAIERERLQMPITNPDLRRLLIG
jgi:hypothetical protein